MLPVFWKDIFHPVDVENTWSEGLLGKTLGGRASMEESLVRILQSLFFLRDRGNAVYFSERSFCVIKKFLCETGENAAHFQKNGDSSWPLKRKCCQLFLQICWGYSSFVSNHCCKAGRSAARFSNEFLDALDLHVLY